jgi:XTP/dITP diphosphohydrolase
MGISIRQLRQEKLELQSSSLRKIAMYALKHISSNKKGSFLVEDSGLFVNALQGFPGPFSSYVLTTISLNGLLRLMQPIQNRKARFESAVAVASPSGQNRVFSGVVQGKISHRVRGREGFGYDPIFVPIGSKKTFGESGLEIKNRQSHRARAFRKFGVWYKKQIGTL